mmetsp:Transcript_27193/g.78096  ORF Transcript_27193/g.78096 Transcript_27193/m.78096 type:complete len:212 (+) Transcript_27193:428-1063(+)
MFVLEVVKKLLQRKAARPIRVSLHEELAQVLYVLAVVGELVLDDQVPVLGRAPHGAVHEDACHDIEEGQHGEGLEDEEEQLVGPVHLFELVRKISPAESAQHCLNEREHRSLQGPKLLDQQLHRARARVGLILQCVFDGLREDDAEDEGDDQHQGHGPHDGVQGVQHGEEHHPQLPERLHHLQNPHDPDEAQDAHELEDGVVPRLELVDRH